MHLAEIWPRSPQDWLFVASLLVPPVLNGIAWWRWSKTTTAPRRRSGVTVMALLLNTAAVAATSLITLAALTTAVGGGAPDGTTLFIWNARVTAIQGQLVGAAALFVVGSSVVSAVRGLFARSGFRVVLVASSVLAGAFWPLLITHIGIR